MLAFSQQAAARTCCSKEQRAQAKGCAPGRGVWARSSNAGSQLCLLRHCHPYTHAICWVIVLLYITERHIHALHCIITGPMEGSA